MVVDREVNPDPTKNRKNYFEPIEKNKGKEKVNDPVKKGEVGKINPNNI